MAKQFLVCLFNKRNTCIGMDKCLATSHNDAEIIYLAGATREELFDVDRIAFYDQVHSVQIGVIDERA